MSARFYRDDIEALPVGMSRSILAIAGTSIALGCTYLFGDDTRFTSAGLRPANALGLNRLAWVFVLIACLLIFSWVSGYLVIASLRFHSLYFGFWACMSGFAWKFYGTSGAGVWIYLGLCLWSMLCVATIKQWRRISALVERDGHDA